MYLSGKRSKEFLLRIGEINISGLFCALKLLENVHLSFHFDVSST